MAELIVPMVIEKSGAVRALVRHLLAITARQDHLPRHRDRRSGREPDHRADARVRARRLRSADLAVHQLARRRDVDALFAIYDVMQYVRCEVATICMGMAASAAAVLLAAGAPGKSLLPAQRPCDHPPAARADRTRTSRRHRDRRRGRPPSEATDGRDPREAHRTGPQRRSSVISTATTSWGPSKPRRTASSTRSSSRGSATRSGRRVRPASRRQHERERQRQARAVAPTLARRYAPACRRSAPTSLPTTR